MSYLNVLQFKLYAHDYSPFLYFTVDGQILYTFDTETMELLPPLQFEWVTDTIPNIFYLLHSRNVKIESILSVREDVILLKGRNDTADFYLLTAQLPKRYAYVCSNVVNFNHRRRTLDTHFVCTQASPQVFTRLAEKERNEGREGESYAFLHNITHPFTVKLLVFFCFIYCVFVLVITSFHQTMK